uniref:Ig-like domain-containing protein n=1 Tax=Denticeps clupeoides TaxID=299321 RepID=A0AAY4C7K2_9TELE
MHVLLFLLLFITVLLPAQLRCPALCSCAHHRHSSDAGIRTVHCKDPTMAAVPPGVPLDTVKLRLERTSLGRVPRLAFSALQRLQYLWLTYNSITTLHPRSFSNLSALHELRLDGNLLATFPWQALRDTPRLRTLSLHDNCLSSRVPAHAARFLGGVTYLDLSSNRLKTLPNKVTGIWSSYPRDKPAHVQRKVVLGLQDNPWICDCRLSMLLKLSRAVGSSLVLLDQYLTCNSPWSFLVSPPSLGSNVLLRCNATGFPTPALTWIKVAGPNIHDAVEESPMVGISWSMISLRGISYKDAGEYRCRARNTAGASEVSVSLNVVGVVNKDVEAPAPTKQTQVAPTKQNLVPGPSESCFKFDSLNQISCEEGNLQMNVIVRVCCESRTSVLSSVHVKECSECACVFGV